MRLGHCIVIVAVVVALDAYVAASIESTLVQPPARPLAQEVHDTDSERVLRASDATKPAIVGEERFIGEWIQSLSTGLKKLLSKIKGLFRRKASASPRTEEVAMKTAKVEPVPTAGFQTTATHADMNEEAIASSATALLKVEDGDKVKANGMQALETSPQSHDHTVVTNRAELKDSNEEVIAASTKGLLKAHDGDKVKANGMQALETSPQSHDQTVVTSRAELNVGADSNEEVIAASTKGLLKAHDGDKVKANGMQALETSPQSHDQAVVTNRAELDVVEKPTVKAVDEGNALNLKTNLSPEFVPDVGHVLAPQLPARDFETARSDSLVSPMATKLSRPAEEVKPVQPSNSVLLQRNGKPAVLDDNKATESEKLPLKVSEDPVHLSDDLFDLPWFKPQGFGTWD